MVLTSFFPVVSVGLKSVTSTSTLLTSRTIEPTYSRAIVVSLHQINDGGEHMQTPHDCCRNGGLRPRVVLKAAGDGKLVFKRVDVLHNLQLLQRIQHIKQLGADTRQPGVRELFTRETLGIAGTACQ